jgi:hypothetical protein
MYSGFISTTYQERLITMSARIYRSISDFAGILSIVLFLITVCTVGGYAPAGFDKMVEVFAVAAILASAVFAFTRWRSTL